MNSILNGVSKINYGVKIRMKSREKQTNYLRSFYLPSLYVKFKTANDFSETLHKKVIDNFLKSSYN